MLQEAKRHVPREFDRVARGYDALSAMNPGYAKHLGWSAARLDVADDADLVDLCCGTGLSTLALKRAYPNATITGLDASQGMLEYAATKEELTGVRWIHGDAMDPAAAGAVGPYDGILMAYGIRNVPDPDLCLRRLRQLLRPGGSLCLHEYSVAGSPWSRCVWQLVTLGVVIPLGTIVTGSSQIFRYLRRSVMAFDSVPQLEERLRRAGFVDVRTAAMDGWQRGVVHTFCARRPRE
ncbi:MAG: class I SAM-dependent methyltransferase [Candidatus Latescibacterota bacterium]|nr:MAG: class I SAM-dependent methyltransferase [Candidatus Latescibacterota bacterium]